MWGWYSADSGGIFLLPLPCPSFLSWLQDENLFIKVILFILEFLTFSFQIPSNHLFSRYQNLKPPYLFGCCCLWKIFFFFFYVDQFKSFSWICYNIASAVCFGVLATGDLSSLTRERTPPSTLEGEVLTWENLNFRTKWFFIFYYFWLHWVFVAARGLCSGHRLLFCYGAQALELVGFSSCSWTTREVQNGTLNP